MQALQLVSLQFSRGWLRGQKDISHLTQILHHVLQEENTVSVRTVPKTGY